MEVKDSNLIMKSPLANIKGSEGTRYRLRVVLDATTTISEFNVAVRVTPTVETNEKQVVLGRGDRVTIYPTGRLVKDLDGS